MLVDEIFTRNTQNFAWDSPIDTVKNYISYEVDSHIFIVENGQLITCVSRENVVNQTSSNLASLQDAGELFFLNTSHQVLDAIPLMSEFHSNIVPIIDEEGTFMGSLMARDVLDELAMFPVFREPCVLLILSGTNLNFSLSEITQIVEAENVKIFALQISRIAETEIEVMIKISLRNVQNAVDALQRFGYTLLYSSHLDRRKETFKNRLDFVQKYLEI